jgi:hypothetical protein
VIDLSWYLSTRMKKYVDLMHHQDMLRQIQEIEIRLAWRPVIHQAYAVLQQAGARPKDQVLLSSNTMTLEVDGVETLVLVRRLFQSPELYVWDLWDEWQQTRAFSTCIEGDGGMWRRSE